ncbi:MAG: iron complex outerrane recepter protein [Sphingomonadales bacterium]|jgi:iron complex outermembrane receptor protein|nr:iron complex outerrane recepter protein [Sphingomonadales bacterium]
MTINKAFWLRSSASLLCLGAILPGAANAQADGAQATPPGAETPTAESDDAIQDVVVTAQKQAVGQSLQRVPMSITAINTDVLRQSQAISIVDVGRLAPNVSLQTAASFPGFPNFTIRGQSISTSLRTLDPTVTLVLDGMPLADPYGVLIDTFDLESIEILRGPQGILFGRNATGGAVVVRTRRPRNEVEIEAAVRLGNDGRFDQSLLISGPLAGEQLRGKITLLHRSRGGLNNDSNNGTFVPAPGNPTGSSPVTNSQVDQVGEDVTLIRPTLVWEPSPNLEVTLLGEYMVADYGGSSARIIQPRPILLNGFGYTPPPFGHQIDQNASRGSNFEIGRLGLEVNWNVGPGVISSITGWRKVSGSSLADNDGVPFSFLEITDNPESRQISQEIRFASTFSENVRFVVGGYYSDLDLDSVETRVINTVIAGAQANFATLRQRGQYAQDAQIQALFANVDITPIEGLTLSGGLRYTHEEKDIDIVLLAVCPNGVCSTTHFQRSGSWNDLSPRAAISYQVTPEIMAFASYNTGFRSGNFNGRAANPLGIGPSDPEKVESYEAGFKTTFWNRRVRINVTAFHSLYSDIQQVITNQQAIQTIVNAASATINGAEVEVTLRPVRGLQLDAAIGYTDAKYDSFIGLDLTGDAIPDPVLARALHFQRVPKYTFTAAISYAFDLGTMGNVTARTSYSYRSRMFTDLVNTPQLVVPGHGVWDASLAWEATDHIRVTAFGRNIANTNYWDLGLTLPFGYIAYGGEPRTYGVELAYRF